MPHCWRLTQQPVEKNGWWWWWMQMPGSLLKKMMLAWFREPWMLGLKMIFSFDFQWYTHQVSDKLNRQSASRV